MHDDVGTVFEGATEVGRGDGVVDDQRYPVLVCDLGQLFEVGDVAEWVTDRFAEDGLGLVIDQGGETGRVAVIGKAHVDAVLRQGVGKQVVGAAVERRGRDDVVAGLGDGEDGVGDCGHAGGQCQRADAALDRRDALLEHILGWVHDPGVDVARDLEVEEVGTVLGVVEGVRGRLVNRYGDGLGGCFRAVAGVQGEGFEFHAESPGAGCVPTKMRW